MAFERAITIREALDAVHRHDYVLPAIQREFVWQPEQIARLFDSLMRGYPMGSFLFWKVEPATAQKFKFYDFVRGYHQRDAPHCPALATLGHRDVTAVLDGQQRLTALNIGLRGSYTKKEPRKWRSSPDAYPLKKLYLNLVADALENEDGLIHDFRFLSEERAGAPTGEEQWFAVGEVLSMPTGPDMHEYLVDRGLGANKDAYRRLDRLHRVVHTDEPITYFLERDQQIDKVLNIFIRVNSGGTTLSYSDLLLSIATAQWTKIDARRAIHDLVDDLNGADRRFELSKDFVLKAGLMLCDIASVGFKVENFDAENMRLLEDRWSEIERTLRITAKLAMTFGFTAQTLTADSALLPLAYYVMRRGLTDSYCSATKHRDDREALRRWLVRSLLKPGTWGSGLDTTLTALRRVIKDSDGERFPIVEIDAELSKRGRALRFEEDEIQDLADVEYGDRRTFGLLSLLFPHVDLANLFHVDHVFPRARFRRDSLIRAGVPAEVVDRYKDSFERLANLQLLDGVQNVEKSAAMPAEWAAKQHPTPAALSAYLARHDLGTLPTDMRDFESFYTARRARLVERLRDLLRS